HPHVQTSHEIQGIDGRDEGSPFLPRPQHICCNEQDDIQDHSAHPRNKSTVESHADHKAPEEIEHCRQHVSAHMHDCFRTSRHFGNTYAEPRHEAEHE